MIKDFNITISLGNRCATSIWAVENNWRDTKQNGYKTCPFDLCVTNYKGIVECMKDDFLNLTNTKYISLEYYGFKNIHVDNAYEGQLLIYNTKYDFCFNHESPCHANLHLIQEWTNGPTQFIDNNYQLFIERYNIRIQNIKNYLNSNKHVFFLFKWDDPNTQTNDCLELKNILKEKYPKLNYTIHIIS